MTNEERKHEFENRKTLNKTKTGRDRHEDF